MGCGCFSFPSPCPISAPGRMNDASPSAMQSWPEDLRPGSLASRWAPQISSSLLLGKVLRMSNPNPSCCHCGPEDAPKSAQTGIFEWQGLWQGLGQGWDPEEEGS